MEWERDIEHCSIYIAGKLDAIDLGTAVDASDVHPSAAHWAKKLAALGILSGGHWQSHALATSGRAECSCNLVVVWM